MKALKNILITMGDPAGISGEVIVKALVALAHPKEPIAKQVRALLAARPANLYVAGDQNVLARSARIVRAAIPIDVVEDFSPSAQAPTRLRLFNLSDIEMA